MLQVFRREIVSGMRGILLGCVGMALFVAMGFYEFGALADMDASMMQLMEAMPRIVLVLFGVGELSLDSPEGYYACIYTFTAIFAYAHAALLGGDVLTKEERDRTADFLYSRPRSRSAIITGKLLACLLKCLLLSATAWAVSLIALLPYTEVIAAIHWSSLGMFLTQCLFLLAGMCLSTLSRDHKKGGRNAAFLVLGSYVLGLLIELKGDVAFLDFLSPFRYFSATETILRGLRPGYLLLTAALLAISAFVAYHRYARRDLHAG